MIHPLPAFLVISLVLADSPDAKDKTRLQTQENTGFAGF
jgi:hypothetical protein